MADDQARIEAEDALRVGGLGADARRYAVAVHHWAGGWPSLRDSR